LNKSNNFYENSVEATKKVLNFIQSDSFWGKKRLGGEADFFHKLETTNSAYNFPTAGNLPVSDSVRSEFKACFLRHFRLALILLPGSSY
jgi:hypothetical protein